MPWAAALVAACVFTGAMLDPVSLTSRVVASTLHAVSYVVTGCAEQTWLEPYYGYAIVVLFAGCVAATFCYVQNHLLWTKWHKEFHRLADRKKTSEAAGDRAEATERKQMKESLNRNSPSHLHKPAAMLSIGKRVQPTPAACSEQPQNLGGIAPPPPWCVLESF